MKKLLICTLLLGWLAVPASAQGKHKSTKGDCPAATCTDHSYDIAYAPPNPDAGRTKKQGKNSIMVKGNNCPAATCTDHSLDIAYSPEWKEAVAAQTKNDVTMISPVKHENEWRPAFIGPYYNMKNYTVYGRSVTGVTRPSAYEGDYAPTYEGPIVNAYRNMRANNYSEPLPANNGK